MANTTTHAKKPTDAGTNRTGMATSPIDGRRLIEAADATEPPLTNGHTLDSERVAIADDAGPVGTLPPPLSLKGLIKTLVESARGHRPAVFLDTLGERLAYERIGTRLYEALLVKFDVAEHPAGGPAREQLERIRDDELRHFLLLRDAMDELGVDPTAMTPRADVIAVAGAGWVQVLSDPRTTFTQCLEVMLIAELADNDGWMLLAGLADALGFDDLAGRFRVAQAQEDEHVQHVRAWISNALFGQAGAEPPAPGVHPTARH